MEGTSFSTARVPPLIVASVFERSQFGRVLVDVERRTFEKRREKSAVNKERVSAFFRVALIATRASRSSFIFEWREIRKIRRNGKEENIRVVSQERYAGFFSTCSNK